jgi:hypothetical protein
MSRREDLDRFCGIIGALGDKCQGLGVDAFSYWTFSRNLNPPMFGSRWASPIPSEMPSDAGASSRPTG